jgi:hypothetical protein
LASAAIPASRTGPWKESQNCPRGSAPIAEIEMIRSRIIEIDGAFHETKAEKPHIEVQISLRIAGNRSDVMKSGDFAIHQGDEDVRSNSREKVRRERTTVRSDRAVARPD